MTVVMRDASFTNSSPVVKSSGTLKFHIIRYGDFHAYKLLKEYHKLRKDIFVDQLEWDLPHENGEERDQYDNPSATYIISERDGVCQGGLRLAPTTTIFEADGRMYSYMVRDAVRGELDSIPQDVVTDTPVSPNVWEMTRVVSPSDGDHLRDLIAHTTDFLRSKGATDFLFLSRPGSGRICRVWGHEVTALGPLRQIGTGRYQVFSVSTDKKDAASALAA